MRSLLLFLELTMLIPIALARPFVGVLIYSFISFSNLHRLTFGISDGMPWAYMTAIATLIGCFVAREPKRLPVNPTTVLIVLFIICIGLTSFVARLPADRVEPKWEAVTKVFFFVLVTIALVRDKYRIHALLWVMVISLGYFGVKGGGFTLLTGGGGRVLGPPSTMIADNNHLAAGLLVTLPLMNYLRLQSAHRIVRLGLLCAMILTLFAVVGSYSRGALIGLAAVSVVLWLRSSNKIVTGVAVAVAVYTAITFMPPEWVERMSTLRHAEETNSGQSRTAIWMASLQMAIHNPLTGVGFMGPYDQGLVDQYANGTTARAVHSIWFEPIGEHGFPTFLVWLGISFAGVVNTFGILRASKGVAELLWCRDLARMAQVSIVAYMVAGTFLSLCYWDFYFTIIAVLAGTRAIVRETVQQTTSAEPSAGMWRRGLIGGISVAGRPARIGAGG